ncbi:MAG: acyltransferase [Aeromicrobium sp.]
MTRTNNFDALRLIGAMAVVVGHAYHLTGRPEHVPFVLGYPVQTLGVVIFFAISGYLITASWQRKTSLVPYFLARGLRIFPGLFLVVLVCILVLGPLVTTFDLGQYSRSSTTWSYLSNLRLEPFYALPGTFKDVPYPGVVNGSLWTLPAEFFCYLVVPLVCLRLGRFGAVGMTIFLGISLWLGSIPPDESAVVYGTRISDAAGMWVFFAAGALLWIAQQSRKDIFRTDIAVIAVAVHLMVMALWPQWVHWMSWATLPYVVLTIGLASTSYLRGASRYGDFSYGLYLWSFPTQQVVVLVLGVTSMWINLVVVTAFSLALAFVSWHLVESPSLKLKKTLTRRSERPATAVAG